MSGKLIVIEGLDGCGKETQAKLLFEEFSKQKKPVQMISFPDYDSTSSALVKMYLAGEFGSHPNDVNAYAASAFYAVDRYASYKRNWKNFYEDGGTIIADRYTTSNAIYQCSKLPEEQWDSYLNWLFEFEYVYLGIPRPDLVVYLQGDTDISQKLMNNRYGGDENKKDIHERNLGYMNCSNKAGEYCASIFEWKKIQCIADGAMRSVEAIHTEVKNIALFNESTRR